jgi:hypothetical protein
MASEADILADLNFVTDRLSTQVRTIAFGALAFSWGILIGDSASAKNLTAQLKWHLVGVCAAAVFTLFIDFAQYCAAYKETRTVYLAAQGDPKHEAQFDEGSLYFRRRNFFFFAKLAALSTTVFWLLIILVHWLVTSYSR